MVDWLSMERACSELQMEDDKDTYYTPQGGASRKIDDVIFTSPDNFVSGSDLVFEGVGPQFSVLNVDVPELAQGDAFSRAGVNYKVTSLGRDESYRVTAYCRLN